MTSQSTEPLTALPSCSSLFTEYLARDRAFKNIGPKRATALLNAFGAKVRIAMASIDDRVVEIIGEASAINAAAVLETRIPEVEFLEWLASVGADIPIQKAIRLARAWGEQGTDAVQRNPYLLLAVSDWRTVDRVAKSLGVSKTDHRRQVAAIEASLMGKGGYSSGCTLVTEEHALQRASQLSGYDLSPLVVDHAVREGAAARLRGALQPPGAAYMEAHCALLLAPLAPQKPCLGVTCPEALDEIVKSYEAVLPFPLTEMQREAVKKPHRHRLTVIAGYAGSGKTTVLRGVCDTQEAIGRKPLIVTLSGRAAQRASEATGRRAVTVARFLLEMGKSHVPLGSENVLIVDEASMLGLVEFWRLLRRLGNASLVLCGDPAQLPPVSPGIVFHHLVIDPDIRKVVLDRVHRQNKTTGIPDLAEGVRDGIIKDLQPFSGPRPGVTFRPCNRDVLCEDILWVGKEMAAGGIERNSMQIIAPTNREIDTINSFFHRRILLGKPNLWPKTQHVAEGEPVMWTQNDPNRGLTNGSLGRIIKIDRENIVAKFDGAIHRLQPQDGQFLQLAWAISVHKAQGSQWQRVIIPVYQSQIVDRSLIYTALTRAQEQVILMGSFAALRDAIDRPPAATGRRCGFPEWMHLARAKEGELKQYEPSDTGCSV